MASNSSPRGEGRLAGAGAGTGLIGLISFIPDTHPIAKQLLIYVAPTATIVIGWGWVYFRMKLSRWMTDRELRNGIARAEIVRDNICNDPNSSPEDKANAIKAVADLKALQILAVQEHYNMVKADLTFR